jgi:hypothetical protein
MAMREGGDMAITGTWPKKGQEDAKGTISAPHKLRIAAVSDGLGEPIHHNWLWIFKSAWRQLRGRGRVSWPPDIN